MKIKASTWALPVIVLVLADAALSTVAIMFAPAAVRGTVTFWLTWAFAAIVGVALCIGVLLYQMRDKQTRLIAFNSFFSLAVLFEGLYIKTFCVYAFTNWSEKIKTTYAIVFEVLITVAFIALIIVKLFGIRFLREVNADQKKTIEQRKSTYIPGLLQMVTSAISASEDEAIKDGLRELSSLLSSSPELSTQDAEMTERELRSIVYQINQYAMLREYGEMGDLIRKAKMKLMERNAKCPL